MLDKRASTQQPPFRAALKTKEACEYLGGISVPTLHRIVKRGSLRPNRTTRHLLFRVCDLDALLREGQSI